MVANVRGISRRALFWLAAGALCSTIAFSELTPTEAAAPGGVPTYFVGTYKVGAQKGYVDMQIVEAVPAGGFFIGWIDIDGMSYLAQIKVNGRNIDAFWFDPADDTQTPLGTISGSVSRDLMTFSGTMKIGKKKGKCSMQAA